MLRYLLPTFEAIVGFFILLLIVRFFLSGTQYERRTALAPAIATLSDWLVSPLSRALPRVRGKESAALAAALLAAALLELAVLGLRGVNLLQMPSVLLPAVLVISVLAVAERCIHLFMFALIVTVITSWLRIGGPVVRIIDYLTSRLLYPFRRFIPPIGGIDFTPFVALLAAQALLLLISDLSRSAGGIF